MRIVLLMFALLTTLKGFSCEKCALDYLNALQAVDGRIKELESQKQHDIETLARIAMFKPKLPPKS